MQVQSGASDCGLFARTSSEVQTMHVRVCVCVCVCVCVNNHFFAIAKMRNEMLRNAQFQSMYTIILNLTLIINTL